MRKPQLYRAAYIGKPQNCADHIFRYGMTGSVDLRGLCQEYVDNAPQFRFNVDTSGEAVSCYVEPKDLYLYEIS